MLGDRKPKPLGENADWAKKNKALIVSMEHRFYGKLQPLPDFSTESLKFLCAEQLQQVSHLWGKLPQQVGRIGQAQARHPVRWGGVHQCCERLDSLKAVHSLLSSTKPDDIAQLDTLFKPCSPILKDSSRAVLEADLYYPFEGLAQANDYSSYGLMAACADFKAEGKSPLEKAVAFCTSLKWATVSATTKPTLSTPM
ncbi:hypothetical protein H257_06559 [Aphanomyces astaci]|uniref:Uncharacterized protein n=1 Tax=Aphanomyces astaci TaxID=112090 RepID=W4GLH1_APHAT|nr:hypothetical protein H257_06559 [Aphanomyces astaci]ETV80201.1 hypothetical protein H257_06559 [Aphanomyces astaci]|eukprot:XP_009830125.1 hypothetical protein H257_06559 [Aphanomyces astaci]